MDYWNTPSSPGLLRGKQTVAATSALVPQLPVETLAFAMTGLPYIGCAWSASRCQRLKPELTELEGYRLVLFISRTLERAGSAEEHALLELFEAAIRALPEDDYLRTRLAQYWRDFKQAIQAGIQKGQKPGIHPKRVPYIIASNFLKNVSRPKSAVDRLLDEQERLKLDSEDDSQPASVASRLAGGRRGGCHKTTPT